MVTLVISVTALFLALLATIFSWSAVTTANRLEAAGAAPAQVEPAAAPTVDNGPANLPTGSVPSLNAQTQYKIKYTDQTLRLTSAGCSYPTNVDLDEPRVQAAEETTDLSYAVDCSPGISSFKLSDGTSGAEVQSSSVTPIECAEQIRTSPLITRADLPLRAGQVYCFTTSRGVALSSAISWKMVVVSVTALSQDGAVTLQATAWDIPT